MTTFTKCTGVALKFDFSVHVDRYLTLSIHLKDTNTDLLWVETHAHTAKLLTRNQKQITGLPLDENVT